MAVAKRNLEEIGESLENMGMNDRPSLLNTEMAKSEEDKNISKGGRKRKSYWTAEERRTRTSVATYLLCLAIRLYTHRQVEDIVLQRITQILIIMKLR
jgi:hypothetical protein